jgi:hypothetical protein
MQRAHPSHFPSPGHTEARLACCREGFLQTLREAADEAIHHPDWPEVLGVVAGECFDDAMGQQNRRWGEQVQGLTASRISLVHDQDMDYAVELMNLEQRLRSFCGRELAAVHLRLKEVFEAIGLTLGSELPLGPEVVCRALRALRDREKLNPDEALDLIGQLESSLCNHLCSFYRRLEHQLAAPALSPVAVPRVVDPEAWIDGPAARSSLPIDPLASLRLSVLARREATVGGAGGMDAGLASVLIERVEAWLGERQKFGEGGPVSLGASELGALLTPNQAVAVEIIESACNHAARAPDLPIPIRTVIGQFRVPLLRLALRSETLLAEPRHPALRMLDLIADLGRSMAPDSSLELPVCQALLRLAQSLGKALRITDKDLLSVLGSVESLLESRQRAALERAAACIDAAHRLERREVALLQASQTVQGMTAEPVDAVAREFIEGYWVHVLAKVAYRYGPGGHKWAARLQERHPHLRGAPPEQPAQPVARSAAERLTVVTGVSGSGKSSLVFDTLYAEGQRRYVETFSPYARQFLDRMDKPQVDRIEGVPPAIAIDQTNPVRTSRSTVGTMTELADHFKLLYARAATLHCRCCGKPVQRDTATASRRPAPACRRGWGPAPGGVLSGHRAGNFSDEESHRAARRAGLHPHPAPADGKRRAACGAGPLSPRQRRACAPDGGAGGGAAPGARPLSVHALGRCPGEDALEFVSGCIAPTATSPTADPLPRPVLVQLADRCLRDLPRLRPGHRGRFRPGGAGRVEDAGRRGGEALADRELSSECQHDLERWRRSTAWRWTSRARPAAEHRQWLFEGDPKWKNWDSSWPRYWYGVSPLLRLAGKQGLQDAHPGAAVALPQLHRMPGLPRRRLKPDALLWRLPAAGGDWRSMTLMAWPVDDVPQ